MRNYGGLVSGEFECIGQERSAWRTTPMSPLREEFFAVADYIVEQDPSVNSYLNGQKVNSSRKLSDLLG